VLLALVAPAAGRHTVNAIARLRRVADEYAALPQTERTAWAADLRRLLDEHGALTALLRAYAERSADVVDPNASSLIARTRALLAQIDAAA
jgi:hypothetical protein